MFINLDEFFDKSVIISNNILDSFFLNKNVLDTIIKDNGLPKIERKWIDSHFYIPINAIKDGATQAFIQAIESKTLDGEFYIYSVEAHKGLYRVNYKYQETDNEFRKRIYNFNIFKFKDEERGLNKDDINKKIDELQSQIDRYKVMLDLPLYRE